MVETHVIAHFAIPFAVTVWWTKSWLMDPIASRWRFTISAFSGTIAWVYLAYAATRGVEASGGVQEVYGSISLAYFCGFMAVVSFVGIILGLLLWTEESGTETIGELRRAAGSGFSGRPDER